MTELALTRETLVTMLAELGGIDAVRADYVRDKSYRNHPIGRLGGIYLDELEFNGYSASALNTKEQTIAWLAFDYPTLEPSDVTVDLLRAFLAEHWRDAAANTKAGHVSALHCFFAWAHDNDHLPVDPARKLRSPRRADTERRAHPREIIRRLVVAQDTHRDRVAILMLYWCALRRNELRQIQFRHIDLRRRILTVFGKGGRVMEQSIPEPLALELERHILDRGAGPDEFLLYPQKLGRRGRYPSYEREILWEDRLSPLTTSGIDKWFQRARDRAGLGGKEPVLMHEIRHTAGTHMHETGGDLVATQHYLRHRSAATTERTYIHIDRVKAVARVQRDMADPMSDGTA